MSLWEICAYQKKHVPEFRQLTIKEINKNTDNTVRKERKLTQEQLGELIGVQKSQISKLERNTKNVTIETILKVFRALKANVKFSVEMNESEFKVA